MTSTPKKPEGSKDTGKDGKKDGHGDCCGCGHSH